VEAFAVGQQACNGCYAYWRRVLFSLEAAELWFSEFRWCGLELVASCFILAVGLGGGDVFWQCVTRDDAAPFSFRGWRAAGFADARSKN